VAKLRINIDVPTPGSTTVSNVLGLAGVVGLAVCVGGLVGNWWWTGLTASLLLVLIAAVTTYNAAPVSEEPGPATAYNGGPTVGATTGAGGS
jgi:hypothetical protein